MQAAAQLDLPFLTMDQDEFAVDPFPHFAAARAAHPWLARWTLGYDAAVNYVTNITINGGTLNFAVAGGGTDARTINMTGGSIIGNRFDWYTGANGQMVLNTYSNGTSAVLSGGFNLRIGSLGTALINVQDGAAADDLLVSGIITATQPNQEIVNGVLPLAANELAQLDNDPDHPERGQLQISVRGGR